MEDKPWVSQIRVVLERFLRMEWVYLYGSALRIPDFEDIDLALMLRGKLTDRAKAGLEAALLLERSPSRRIRHEARVLKEYLDFEPTYHRIMDRSLERMRTRHGPPQ